MSGSDIHFETRIAIKRKPRRVLFIVSNTTDHKGMKVGFFAEELTRGFLMCLEAGHQVDICSPKGGKVMFDTHSDPRNPDGGYVDDLISLGFAHHSRFSALMEDTPSIETVSVADYDAVWVAGGGGPLLTFKDDFELHQLIVDFYEQGKFVTLMCHGAAILLWAKLSNGKLLAEGKKWTGFTDEEEENVNEMFGMTFYDETIESEANKIDNTYFVHAGLYEPYAVRDGRLITGQQQYSSGLAAEILLEALDE